MTEADRNGPGACAIADGIAAGTMRAQEVVEDCLARTDAREDDLGAWVMIDRDGARDAARRCDAAGPHGALAGVPLGVKDIFAVRGLPWRCGSPIWRDRIAGADAGAVALARRAGAIILGKTETTEFATYTPARTVNPHDPSRTPGGSSSGSAAAVAAGMVPLAFGTQTSGSIIRPASYCGIVGYKPSFDLIEPGGVAPLARSLDTIGLFARSVADVALGTSALSGLDLRLGAPGAPEGLRIWRTTDWPEAEPALVTAWEAFESEAATTASPFPAEIEALLADAPALHTRIMAAQASEALAYEYATAPEMLSDALRAQLEEGQAQPPAQRQADWDALRTLRAQVDAALPRDAVFAIPAATGPAPALARGTGSPAFNRVWTLLGLPCCTVPILKSADGMPLGVQVVGATGNDAGVLRMAHSLLSRYGATH